VKGERVLTVPNALTLARLLSIPVILLLLLAEKDVSATVVFVVAAATDFLDGRIARRRGGAATSYLGTVLDPVADRLMLSSVAAVLAVRGLLPVIVVAMLVGRDVLALVGTLAFRGKIRVNKVGKAATAVLMTSVAVVMYRPGIVGEIMFYAGLGLSLVAGLLYVGAVKRHFGRNAEGGPRAGR
jgi:CDP-diacylglycerol--glycerol-3-phosphate 3-phosphatidyltransferase